MAQLAKAQILVSESDTWRLIFIIQKSWKSHVPHVPQVNNSCPTFEGAIRPVLLLGVTWHTVSYKTLIFFQKWMSHVPRQTESCLTNEWVMSYFWRGHDAQLITRLSSSVTTQSAFKCVLSHVRSSHTAHHISQGHCLFQKINRSRPMSEGRV